MSPPMLVRLRPNCSARSKKKAISTLLLTGIEIYRTLFQEVQHMTREERWGRLWNRYNDERPRKMLAIDGGGIRGLISLGMLRRLETLLAQNQGVGANFRLSDYFDYVAGTSTGAIIAAGLARGM